MTELRTTEPLPSHMRNLPVDERGWVVPFFVGAGDDGKPDHRVVDARKWVIAHKERRCWICGGALGSWLAFLVGPMCVVNRTVSEPPSHRDCAEWAARNCPFVSNPNATRRHDHVPGDANDPGGMPLWRNPGVMAVYVTRSYDVFNVPAGVGNPGVLITMGEPSSVTWWKCGRPATRADVEESTVSGIPSLMALATQQGGNAVDMLSQMVERAKRTWPDTAADAGA